MKSDDYDDYELSSDQKAWLIVTVVIGFFLLTLLNTGYDLGKVKGREEDELRCRNNQ